MQPTEPDSISVSWPTEPKVQQIDTSTWHPAFVPNANNITEHSMSTIFVSSLNRGSLLLQYERITQDSEQ